MNILKRINLQKNPSEEPITASTNENSGNQSEVKIILDNLIVSETFPNGDGKDICVDLSYTTPTMIQQPIEMHTNENKLEEEQVTVLDTAEHLILTEASRNRCVSNEDSTVDLAVKEGIKKSGNL